MGSFQILEHTGEIGVLAHGETLEQAFSNAAKGMFSFMVKLRAVEEREMRQVEADAPDMEALLVAWLNELILQFEVDGMVFKRFHIQEMKDTYLKALCYGEKLDIQRHRFVIGPKAATYHMLEVREESDAPGDSSPHGWRARVILDI